MIACGAIAQLVSDVAGQHALRVDVHPLPPLLHNRPERIAGQVERLAAELQPSYDSIVVGYADCGTYGALDGLCDRLGLQRLAGLHCYDVLGGASRIADLLAQQPGTYLLTDFLVRSFARTVIVELGLDRHPELRDAYFGSYTRVVWLAQQRTDELETLAHKAAVTLQLPLTIVDTGTEGLARELRRLTEPLSAEQFLTPALRSGQLVEGEDVESVDAKRFVRKDC